MRLTSALAATLFSFVLVGVAQATPIQPGKTTDITLKAPFFRGITPIGNAEADTTYTTPAKIFKSAMASFPITGGTLESDGTLRIEHRSSGIKIGAGISGIVTFENFLINTATSTVSADTTFNHDGSPTATNRLDVFNLISAPGGSNYDLSLTSISNRLNTFFATGGPNILDEGTKIGAVTTNPEILGSDSTATVPAPGIFSLFLFAISLVGFGCLAKQRRVSS